MILFGGIVDRESIQELLNEFNITKLIIRNDRYDEFRNQNNVMLKSEFFKYDTRNNAIISDEKYTDVLSYVIEDYRTHIITEREFRQYGRNSMFNNLQKVDAVVYNSIAILLKESPKAVIFQATPHGTVPFIFAKVAEFMKVKVIFNAHTLLPWKIEPVEGIYKQASLLKYPVLNSGEGLTRLNDFIEEKSGDYETAIPDYELKRQKAYNGKFFSFAKELDHISYLGLKHLPFKIIESVRKYNAYKIYNKLSTENVNSKGLVYYLHYQPERTSIPEGELYSQQFFAIRKLSIIAKELNINVYVKEHPSTFRQPWNSGFRNANFYKAIISLGNIKIISLNFDSYRLMQYALLTFTISGTIIVESLLKGIPVYSFSRRKSIELDGFYNVDDNLQKVIKKVINKEIEVDRKSLINKLELISKNSFDKNIDINTSLESLKFAMRKIVNKK